MRRSEAEVIRELDEVVGFVRALPWIASGLLIGGLVIGFVFGRVF